MYDYDKEKQVFQTNEGMKALVDTALKLTSSGVSSLMVGSIMRYCDLPDSYQRLACIHLLAELGFIELADKGSVTQFDIYNINL